MPAMDGKEIRKKVVMINTILNMIGREKELFDSDIVSWEKE